MTHRCSAGHSRPWKSSVSIVSVRPEDRPAVKADACPLCDKAGVHDHKPLATRQRTDLLPWAIVVTASLVVALIGDVSERWFGIGALSGVVAALVCAWV